MEAAPEAALPLQAHKRRGRRGSVQVSGLRVRDQMEAASEDPHQVQAPEKGRNGNPQVS